MPSRSKSTSRQSQLQAAIGEDATVLPRVQRGGGVYPAAGWYARFPDGEQVYLGDHINVALVTIARLTE